jgi:hypothetical protein
MRGQQGGICKPAYVSSPFECKLGKGICHPAFIGDFIGFGKTYNYRLTSNAEALVRQSYVLVIVFVRVLFPLYPGYHKYCE